MSANPLDVSKVSGSSALKTQLESTLGTAHAGLEFTITGGAIYRWNGTSFDTVSIAGAALVHDAIIAGKVTDAQADAIYTGYPSNPSASVNDAVWLIYKTPINGTVIGPTVRADGNDNFDNVWANRLALSYS